MVTLAMTLDIVTWGLKLDRFLSYFFLVKFLCLIICDLIGYIRWQTDQKAYWLEKWDDVIPVLILP